MTRLIDADALLAEYDRVHKGPPGGARKLIEEAPTIKPETAEIESVKRAARLIQNYCEKTGCRNCQFSKRETWCGDYCVFRDATPDYWGI